MAKDTRARMVEATAKLLQHRGYHGTALSDILAASDAREGTVSVTSGPPRAVSRTVSAGPVTPSESSSGVLTTTL